MNGIIKYNIEPDGCLIGIYTNTGDGKKESEIYPEWAKKIFEKGDRKKELGQEDISKIKVRIKSLGEIEPLEGIYDCVYPSDKKDDPTTCILTIGNDKNNKVFHFSWHDPTILRYPTRTIGVLE